MISNAKYGSRGVLPELNTVSEGVLRGFVVVNPRWAGFEAKNYWEASHSCESAANLGPMKIEAQPGDFDLRGFEVARSQFFQVSGRPCVTVSVNGIQFNYACLQKLNETRFIELLVHPAKEVMAVRPAEENARHSIWWARLARDGKWMPKTICGAAFIPTLYQLFGWNANYKYCVKGTCLCKEEGTVLLFHLAAAETFIPDKIFGNINHGLFRNATRRAVAAYPPRWADTIGDACYSYDRSQEFINLDTGIEWQLMASAKPFIEGRERDFTVSGHIASSIRNLIPQVRQEGSEDGG